MGDSDDDFGADIYGDVAPAALYAAAPAPAPPAPAPAPEAAPPAPPAGAEVAQLQAK